MKECKAHPLQVQSRLLSLFHTCGDTTTHVSWYQSLQQTILSVSKSLHLQKTVTASLHLLSLLRGLLEGNGFIYFKAKHKTKWLLISFTSKNKPPAACPGQSSQQLLSHSTADSEFNLPPQVSQGKFCQDIICSLSSDVVELSVLHPKEP